jgi:deoxyribose-phosphate aldolase
MRISQRAKKASNHITSVSQYAGEIDISIHVNWLIIFVWNLCEHFVTKMGM